MSDRTLTFLREHDPARTLAPLADNSREELRRMIVATTPIRQAHRLPRRLLAIGAVVVLLLGVVGAALAARELFKSPAEEERGLPAGSALFIGTDPTCTTVDDDQFHCTLESAPTVEYIEGSYLGAKMLTVDSTKHIDGGCIARSADGLAWDCYLGEAAVEHEILVRDLLGQYQPGPSHG